jgi:hypothetical protein
MVKTSAGLAWPFALLALLVAASLPLAVRAAWLRPGGDRAAARKAATLAAVLTTAWLAATGAAAASGRLSFTTMPPTIAPVIVGVFVLGIGIGLSRVGERLAAGVPLAALVGLQGFRLPLELMMHRAYETGLMPVQMSYSGRNFDIVTGTTALVVAALLATRGLPRGVVLAWNVMGSLLLLNVVTIALLSTPTPLRVFHNEPANVWITAFPWVWLPAVYVTAALLGHIVIFRRLRMEARHAVSRARAATAGHELTAV